MIQRVTVPALLPPPAYSPGEIVGPGDPVRQAEQFLEFTAVVPDDAQAEARGRENEGVRR
ncbi:hypothetical protein [Streptomyces sp. AM6-12]|uniref:hypothetical protein n=1 Tax=Streptomyces sp. AM6-12 TaxID=3345149 RepID=UPI00378EA6EB